jgi:hypothetical protein
VTIDLPKALAMLEELRADPYGIDWLDLDRLLDAWEFERVSLSTARGWEAWRRYHPRHPELDVILSPSKGVHLSITLRAIEIVDRLREMQRPSA